jgi:hypothetical protein
LEVWIDVGIRIGPIGIDRRCRDVWVGVGTEHDQLLEIVGI